MFYCPKSKPLIELTCHLHECHLGTGCTMWCCTVCIPLSGLDLRNRKVLSIYMYSNKKNITWWQADMDFIFSWQEKQLTRQDQIHISPPHTYDYRRQWLATG